MYNIRKFARRNRGLVGNVYKGKVVRVLPGMEAAFVEIGLERAAFLHVSDIAHKNKYHNENVQVGQILKEGTADALASDEQVRKLYLGENFRLDR